MKKTKGRSQTLTIAQYHRHIKDVCIKMSILSIGTMDVKFNQKKHPYFTIKHFKKLKSTVVYNKTLKRFTILRPKPWTLKTLSKYQLSGLKGLGKFQESACRILNHFTKQIPVNSKNNKSKKSK